MSYDDLTLTAPRSAIVSGADPDMGDKLTVAEQPEYRVEPATTPIIPMSPR